MRYVNHPLFAALVAGILFIPFLGNVHLFDWDEINFAESAREMLYTGEYFRVQINFEPFWEKPPLFFWLQALSMRVFGINEFAARFPNAICGMVTIGLLFHIGKKTLSNRFAWFWVLMMLASITPSMYFKTGIIDPWFNLFIFLAIWQLTRASFGSNNSSKNKLFVWAGIWLGLAVLTKGPVAILVTTLCVLVYIIRNGFTFFFSWKQLLYLGLATALISSLWVAVEIAQNGFQILIDFMAYQAELFSKPVAGHGQPWFYHPIVLLLGCFPSSVFAIQGFFAKPQAPETRHLKQWMFLLFAVVLILFSIVTTKIVHYSSLCWMPLAFMAALAVEEMINESKRMNRLLIVLFLLIGIFLGLLLSLLPLIEHYKHQLIPLIKDAFVVASLSEKAPWNGIEWMIGLAMGTVICYGSILLWRNAIGKAVIVISMVFAVAIPSYLAWIVPKVEVYTQQPAIEFYQQLQNQDVYVESLGHKSYAQYFYTQSKPHTNPEATNIAWLLQGPIDKPAYFVVKVHHVKQYQQYNLQVVAQRGGFALLKRDALPK